MFATTTRLIRRCLMTTPVCLLVCAAAYGQQAGNTPQFTKQELINRLNAIHQRLNSLELAGDYNGMLAYLADDMIRMDAGRPMTTGKQAWSDFATELRDRGIIVQSINHNIVDVWQCGDKVYEYGTVNSSVLLAGATQASDEPMSYFTVWQVSDAGFKAAVHIWNVARPIEQLRTAPSSLTKTRSKATN